MLCDPMRHNNSILNSASGLTIFLFSTQTLAAGANADAGAGPKATTAYNSQRYVEQPRLSNYEFAHFGVEGWGITGTYRPAFEKYAHYTGGGGGLRIDAGVAMGRYLIVDVDFRIAGGAYGQNPRPDLAAYVGWGFSGLRWMGKYPGSFVFGLGVGASYGRPLWLGNLASVHPNVYSRFMLKFSKEVRLQMDYRFSPVSTQLYFGEAWVMRHEAAVSLGYDWLGFGVRGRIEDVSFRPNYEPNLRALAIGGFVALVYK